jgi:hypothetical protein
MISLVPILELRLTLRDKTNYLDGGSPCMLNGRPILNFHEEACKVSTGFRVDIIFVNIMDSTITRGFGMLDVIVFVCIVSALVMEACLMKILSEVV